MPGPGVPPPELDVLLVVPLDVPPLDDAAPELDEVELAAPLEEDDDALSAVPPSPPQASTTTMPIPMTTELPRMMRW